MQRSHTAVNQECWSVCGLHACLQEGELVRSILVSVLVFAQPASTWLKTGPDLRQALIKRESKNVLNSNKIMCKVIYFERNCYRN